jgi:hypothetical protein
MIERYGNTASSNRMHDGKSYSHQYEAYVIKIKISMKRRKLYNFIQSAAHLFEKTFLFQADPTIQHSPESRKSKFMGENFPQT